MKAVSISDQTPKADQCFADLLETISQLMEAGESVDVKQYEEKYPEYAERLRRLVPTLRVLEDIGLSAVRSSSLPKSSRSLGSSIQGTLGDFRIKREIGRGGMGVVYEAEQVSLGRRVAIKVFPFAGVLDPRQLQRFQNEARAAASLKHPNIVTVHWVGDERGVHYYAMDFIEGRTLAHVIAELQETKRRAKGAGRPSSGRSEPAESAQGDAKDSEPERGGNPSELDSAGPSPADTVREPQAALSTQRSANGREFSRFAARLGLQAAEALEHAHQMGVVHRDIKPSNLMVDNRGQVWVTDFGLAMTQAGANLTMTGDVLGTLRYMSPEQVDRKRHVLDHRTDIYSLGVTLYELLTLRPAFDGENRAEIVQGIAAEEPLGLRRLNPSIPRELETIVLKAMAKSPAERYPTAQELADDLRRFLENEPIKARRPTMVQRLAKWSRRHVAVVRSAAVLLLVVSVVSMVSAMLVVGSLQREARQRELAEGAALRERALATAAEERRKVAEQARQDARRSKEAAVQERDAARRNLYLAEMRQAQQYWEDGQISRLIDLLVGHFPEPGLPDLRGWEWYYLLSLCRQDLLTVRAHRGGVASVAWSPDGRQLASTGTDGVGIVWNVENARALYTLGEGAAPLLAAAWSPDGKRLASVHADQTMRIWEAMPRQKLLALKKGVGETTLLTWSPDGKRLAGASGDRVVRIWDADRCEEQHVLAHAYPVYSVAWAPDSRRLASAGYDIVIWDAVDGDRKLAIEVEGAPLYSAAWSPDGQRLATGGGSRKTWLWDAATGAKLREFEDSGKVTSVAWSPDGRLLATASQSQKIQVWDWRAGDITRTLQGHIGSVLVVVWNPDGTRLASGGEDGAIKIWDVTEQQKPAGENSAWSPRTNCLAVPCEDGTIRIVDAAKGHEIRSLTGLENLASQLIWSPDGQPNIGLQTGNQSLGYARQTRAGQL